MASPINASYLATSLRLIDNQDVPDASSPLMDKNLSKFTEDNIKNALTKLGLNDGNGNYKHSEEQLYAKTLLGLGKTHIQQIYDEIVKPSAPAPATATGGKRKSRKNRRSRKVKKSKSQRRRR